MGSAEVVNVYQYDSPARLARIVRAHRQERELAEHDRRYLTSGALKFVSPGRESPADPRNLWKRLSDRARRSDHTHLNGVLLIGAAGVGKTRTCYEVAERAEERDWRALHITGGRTVSTDDLMAAVRTAAARAPEAKGLLLVFDYFDTFEQLDLGLFANSHFGPDEEVPDIACIAAVRPGGLGEARDKCRRWFDEVEVPHDRPHQEAIAYAILEEVAPTALQKFGLSELLAICGTRPVIVLLIAQQIEASMPLSDLEMSGLRQYPGLLSWLHRRTREDFLPGDQAEPEQASARDRLLASAVAMAASTQPPMNVEAATGSYLAGSEVRLRDNAYDIIDRLLELGWLLENRDGDLEAVHDIVIDQLLEESLLPNGMVHRNAVWRLLSAMLVHAPTLGRAVSHFARWAEDLEERRQAKVKQSCAQWLFANAEEIGQLLAHPEHLEDGGQAILTMASASLWQAGITATWRQLAEPWLHTAVQMAPRLAHGTFANAIRDMSRDGLPEPLAAAALDWLIDHGTDPMAYLVLESALRAAKDPAVPPDGVIHQGLSWMDHNPGAWGTAYVLAGMFAARGVGPDLEAEIVRRADPWISGKLDSPSASFVIRRWLEHDTMDISSAEKGISHGLAWLKGPRGKTPDASFVIGPLLRHPGLRGEELAEVAAAALTWLRAYGTREYASMVLRALLDREGTGLQPAARQLALDWLEIHGEKDMAKLMLCAVLEDPHLEEADRVRAVGYGLAWLKTPLGTSPDASFVLGAVLPCVKEADDQHDEILSVGFNWLDEHWGSDRFTFVLAPFLAAAAVDSGRYEQVVEDALNWVDHNLADDRASFVLQSLCSSQYLQEGGRFTELIPNRAVAWLRTGPETTKSFHIVLPLIRFAKIDLAQRDVIVRAALSALASHQERQGWKDLFSALIRWAPLDTESVRRIANFCLLRMDEGLSGKPTLTTLLRRGDVPQPQAGILADKALASLEGRVTKTAHMLRGLVMQRTLDATRNLKIADVALEWLEAYGTTPYAKRILDDLAELPSLDATRRSRIASLTQAWHEAQALDGQS